MTQDKLLYFNLRARAEGIRMMYAVAGKPLQDKRVTFEQWGTGLKEKQPLGQLPVYTCEDGELPMSNSAARYVAKKFGMMGSDLWEEALNDMVQETCLDVFNDIPNKIYIWKLLKIAPEPENKDEIVIEIREKFVKRMEFIQSVAEKRNRRFIICDKICLADIWLYTTLEFAVQCLPDSMEITPWVKQFVEKVEGDEKVKNYLSGRPEPVAPM